MSFNPEILTVARGSRGMSQAELAKRMKWAQGKASKVEHGLLEVSIEDVERLSVILEYPADLFYQEDSITGFGTCCLYHRKRASTSIRKLNKLHDEINIRRMQIHRLLKGVTLPQEPNFPNLDIDEYESPEQIAQILRAMWRLPRGPIRKLVDAVESAGGIVVMIDLGTTKIDAVSQRAQGMPPLFFLDRKKPVDRYRYTLAHEIGHIVMHATPSPDAEAEADRFASEFLAPEAEIRHELRRLNISKAANLKLKWRLSMQAIIRKAKDSRAITLSQYKSLCVRISQLGYRKNEPNPLEPESPKILKWLIDLYLGERNYTIEELSKSMLMLENDFRREYLEEGPELGVVG